MLTCNRLNHAFSATQTYHQNISLSIFFFRLVPDVDVEIQSGNLSRVSSVTRINITQSEANVSRGVTSTEFLSDAPSENNSTGSSTVVPGQYMKKTFTWEWFPLECRKVISFCSATLPDWLKKFAPLYRPIGSTVFIRL